MSRGDAGFPAAAFDSQGEIRGIDTDDHIRRRGEEVIQQAGTNTEQFANATQHFHQPHHRKPLHRHQRMKTFGDHFIATDAHKAGFRIAFAQRANQPGTEDIPRCLAGDDRNGYLAGADLPGFSSCHQGLLAQRMMPRSAPRSESISGRTSGTSLKDFSSSSIACSVVRP